MRVSEGIRRKERCLECREEMVVPAQNPENILKRSRFVLAQELSNT
jgi:hypothetical protein